MPAKKTSQKKTATRKTAARSVSEAAAKKATRKTAAKAPARKASKTATQKTASAKKAQKKAAPSATRKTTAKATRKAETPAKPTKKAARAPKASDFVKRPSHTPAIFKPSTKKHTHILFTLEDVREVLRKRGAEESARQAARKTAARAAGGSEPPRGTDDPPRNSKHHAASLDDILGLGSGGQPLSGPGEVPRKFQKYHRMLLELRDQVREELNLHSNDTLKRSQKEDAGDIAISVDAGTDNFDRDFALSLLSSEQEALKEIEAALQRIYDGRYGVCEVTGKPIKAERLMAVPFTRFSLEGQREFESSSPRRVSRAGAFLNEASGEAISFGDEDGDN